MNEEIEECLGHTRFEIDRRRSDFLRDRHLVEHESLPADCRTVLESKRVSTEVSAGNR
jgi:hypothetical protein